MVDYEYLFSMNLHAKLKEKIVGKIFVTVKPNDTLYVKIETFEGLTYDVSVHNFSERFLNGYSTDYVAYEIVREYKKFITKKILHKYIK